MLRSPILFSIILLLASDRQQSEPPLNLVNGPNPVDLFGDGSKGEIFVAWRGNYNAHGFSSVAFNVLARSDLGDATNVWQLVPFFGGPRDPSGGRETYGTTEGADCTLGDLRVVPHARAAAEVVIA